VKTFLPGALGVFEDFTTGSTSCEGGSSGTGVSVTVAVAANLSGSSLSLKRKQKLEYSVQVDKEEKRVYENNSKILMSPRGQKALLLPPA
jgi:hypothetical protein